MVRTRSDREPPLRRPVLHDVARLAGVSHQTVSRVVNNHPNVRPETRERVVAAMKTLNYRPNILARSLATSRTHRIGVIGFDVRFFGPGSTVVAIERAAHASGYGIAMASMTDLAGDDAVAALAMLDAQRVDGLIVIAPRRGALRALGTLPRDLPTVALEADLGSDLSVVAIDQRLGGRLATEHLLQLGHRTVWHIAGPADWSEAELRVAGWRDGLADAEAPVPPVLRGDWTSRSGYDAGIELADNPEATGIFAANDQIALGVLRAFHDTGIAVPDERSVVGFDDLPEAEFFLPSLTTVRQDFDAVGRKGLRRLLLEIDEASPARRRKTLIRPDLIVRASSGPPGTAVIRRDHGRRGRPSATR